MRLDALHLAGWLLIGLACAGSSTSSTTLAAQPVKDPVGCYRFNRPMGHSAAGHLERSTPGWWTLELQPEGQAWRPNLTAAEQRMWIRGSSWSRTGDTVWVRLSTGLVGWDIALTPISGDTLGGMARYLTDAIVVGSEPLRVPVVAVKEHCPFTVAADTQHLEQLNRDLFESAILRKDTTQWSALSLQQLLVVPPGGVLENRAQAFAGVRAFDVRALTVVTDIVVIHENTAVLVGRLTLDGEVRPLGRLGPLRFMTVFVRTNAGWKLLARSLTPCSERAVQTGRC